MNALRSRWLAGAASIVALALIAPPLALLLQAGASTSFDWDRQLGLLARTVRVSVLAAAVALAAGLPGGFLLATGRFPGARLLGAVAVGLFAIPSFIHAIAWTALAEPHLTIRSLGGAGTVLGLWLSPLVMLMAARGLRQASSSQVEAALLTRGRARTLLGVVLPAAKPWLAAAALVTFALAAGNYGVPEHMRVHVYPVEVMACFSALGDAPGAAAASLPLCALLALAALAAALVTASEPGSDSLPIRSALDGPAGTVAMMGLLAPAGLLPFGALAARLESPATLGEALRVLAPDLPAAVLVAAIAGLAAGAAGAVLAVAQRWARPGAAGRLTAAAAMLAFAIPEAVTAVAAATWLSGSVAATWLYGQTAGLTLALALRHAPLAALLGFAAVGAIGHAEQEAAALAGAPPGRFLGRIVLPRLAPALGASALLCAALSLADLETALVMTPPGTNPLGTRLFNMVHYGLDSLLAGSILLVAGTVAAAAAGATRLLAGAAR